MPRKEKPRTFPGDPAKAVTSADEAALAGGSPAGADVQDESVDPSTKSRKE